MPKHWESVISATANRMPLMMLPYFWWILNLKPKGMAINLNVGKLSHAAMVALLILMKGVAGCTSYTRGKMPFMNLSMGFRRGFPA